MRSLINKTQFFALFIALFTVTAFTACSDVAGPDNGSDITAEEYNEESNIFGSSFDFTKFVTKQCGIANLYAGKNTNSGLITIDWVEGDIVVSYLPNEGWGISETHLWVGKDMSDLPTAGNGAPKNGHLPYGGNYNPATTSTSYTIDPSDHGISFGDTFYVVAHAVTGEFKGGSLKKTETAYAGEEKGDSNRWFYYTSVNCESDDFSSQGGFSGNAGNRR